MRRIAATNEIDYFMGWSLRNKNSPTISSSIFSYSRLLLMGSSQTCESILLMSKKEKLQIYIMPEVESELQMQGNERVNMEFDSSSTLGSI
jgi:hypothetical protein